MELIVRPMELGEVELRIDYFLNASPDYLDKLGVDPACLPTREEWLKIYQEDYSLPLEKRKGMQLLWLGDGKPVGFSSADKIQFGQKANMHLHVLEAEDRNTGIGTECVLRSAALYFELLKLERLYCQPNAFNTAPNRTLQKAGFKYLQTYETIPSTLNFYQPVNQWVLERGYNYLGR